MRSVVLVALVAVATLIVVATFVEAAAKKKKGKKKSSFVDKACQLKYGLSESDCNDKRLTCNWNWVGTCPSGSGALAGNGGCQPVGSCAKMRCASTCNNNKGCKWLASEEECTSDCLAQCAQEEWINQLTTPLIGEVIGCTISNRTVNTGIFGAYSNVPHKPNTGFYSYKFLAGNGMVPGSCVTLPFFAFQQGPAANSFGSVSAYSFHAPGSVLEFRINSTVDLPNTYMLLDTYLNGIRQTAYSNVHISLNIPNPSDPSSVVWYFGVGVSGGTCGTLTRVC